MSRNGTLLPIPASPLFRELIDSWPEEWASRPWPRSAWLGLFEEMLRGFYPSASSADLRLTARHSAPFFLKDGPNVP